MTMWRSLGSLLVALGLALLIGLGWQLWGTGLATESAQQTAAQQLVGPAVESGSGDAAFRIKIPALDLSQVVVRGVDDDSLTRGPGHYPQTADPGNVGNVGIAGHRVTYGAPFQRLDELTTCDEIILEGRTRAWTYRVLPIEGQPSPCGLSGGLLGREIVDPGRGDVLEPVADRRLLTLTTCHPRYSAKERLTVRAELVSTTRLR